jgi:hypothetical protein
MPLGLTRPAIASKHYTGRGYGVPLAVREQPLYRHVSAASGRTWRAPVGPDA